LEGNCQPSGFAMQLPEHLAVFYAIFKVLSPSLAKLQLLTLVSPK
jgi:hypothetical protein